MSIIINIPLTQCQFAKVDLESSKKIKKYKYHSHKSGSTFYAARVVVLPGEGPTRGRHRLIFMHRDIMGKAPIGMDQVDHINGNGLDNRIENLRWSNQKLNHMNQKKRSICNGKRTFSKYKGVYKSGGGFRAAIQCPKEKKKIHLGCFRDERSAAIAYDFAAMKLFGEYARLNAPLLKKNQLNVILQKPTYYVEE